MKEVNKRQGCVYVLENENGLIKMGTSIHPRFREHQIVSISGYSVEKRYQTSLCWNPYKIENLTHKIFADKKKQGEWFYIEFNEAARTVKELFSISAILQYDKPELDTFAIMEEFTKRSCGVVFQKADEAKSIDDMAVALSNFYGKKYDASFLISEIDLFGELGEYEEILTLKSQYPNLSNGINDKTEWEEYVSSSYALLKESCLCLFPV